MSLILTTMLNSIVFSQGTDSRRIYQNKDKFFLGIVLTPQQTSIKSDGFSTSIVYDKGTSMNIAFNAGYYFSNILGINIGAGLNPYTTQLSLTSYSVNYNTRDSEDEEYQMQIDGRNITETQKISFLSIPVTLALRIPAGDMLGFFLNAGVSAEIPVVSKYDGSGVFSYDGYYPAYPVTLEDIPEYGFENDLSTSVDGDLIVNSFNAALTASGGLFVYLGSSLQLTLGAHFNRSLSGISAYEADNSFKLTSARNELNSIMAGSTDTGVQAIGISLGLRYFIQ